MEENKSTPAEPTMNVVSEEPKSETLNPQSMGPGKTDPVSAPDVKAPTGPMGDMPEPATEESGPIGEAEPQPESQADTGAESKPEISPEQQAENQRIADETKANVDKMISENNKKFEVRADFLKDFRSDCRGIENAINTAIEKTPFVSEARKKMMEARHWAGKMLGLVGEQNPYKNEDNTDKKEIVPAADPAKSEPEFAAELDNRGKIRELRVMIEHLIGKFESEAPLTGELEAWWGNYVIMRLHEARMWLGEALAE